MKVVWWCVCGWVGVCEFGFGREYVDVLSFFVCLAGFGKCAFLIGSVSLLCPVCACSSEYLYERVLVCCVDHAASALLL